jgi:hypothetical protein
LHVPIFRGALASLRVAYESEHEPDRAVLHERGEFFFGRLPVGTAKSIDTFRDDSRIEDHGLDPLARREHDADSSVGIFYIRADYSGLGEFRP